MLYFYVLFTRLLSDMTSFAVHVNLKLSSLTKYSSTHKVGESLLNWNHCAVTSLGGLFIAVRSFTVNINGQQYSRTSVLAVHHRFLHRHHVS